jgi:tetratricopeptide (TPR) repeat protein
MKRIILLAAISLSSLYTFSQSQERILQKQSNNLKEPPEAALDLFNKGVNYSNDKEYILANRDYEMAIALDSDYVDAYNNLGLNFYEMNLMDSAGYYLRISLGKLPSGTTALQNLGLVEEKTGDLPKALGHYKQIISFDPQSPEGYYNAARALLTMGKLEEGLSQAQQAEKIYTKLKSPGLSDCHYLLFVAYYNLQNKPMAKKYLVLCKNENVQIPAEMEQALK